MSEDKKRAIKETVDIIKTLDSNSLLLIKAGAEMLKARQQFDKATNCI